MVADWDARNARGGMEERELWVGEVIGVQNDQSLTKSYKYVSETKKQNFLFGYELQIGKQERGSLRIWYM